MGDFQRKGQLTNNIVNAISGYIRNAGVSLRYFFIDIFLKSRYGVPSYRVPYPVGLKTTDNLFKALKSITGKDMPVEIQKERGRLLDAMADTQDNV